MAWPVNEDGAGEVVEKLMSISRAEFEAGLKRLTGVAARPNGQDGYVLADISPERRTVCCSFEALPDAVLGDLLQLPRARVRLHLALLSSDARAEFMLLFDRTFQRGGG
jgi:hypothetical protein